MTTRKGFDIIEKFVEPKTHISHTAGGDKELPILAELRQLSVLERKRLLFDILRIEDKWMTRLEESLLFLKIDRQDIGFWKYFLIVVKCWKQSSQMKCYYFEFIRAIVLSLIYYRHHSLIKDDFNGLTSVSQQRFKPFITHYYCEFEAIYMMVNELMSLLGNPVDGVKDGIKLHHCMNGILYYNLFDGIIDKRIPLWPFKEYRLNTINNFIICAVCED